MYLEELTHFLHIIMGSEMQKSKHYLYIHRYYIQTLNYKVNPNMCMHRLVMYMHAIMPCT